LRPDLNPTIVCVEALNRKEVEVFNLDHFDDGSSVAQKHRHKLDTLPENLWKASTDTSFEREDLVILTSWLSGLPVSSFLTAVWFYQVAYPRSTGRPLSSESFFLSDALDGAFMDRA